MRDTVMPMWLLAPAEQELLDKWVAAKLCTDHAVIDESE